MTHKKLLLQVNVAVLFVLLLAACGKPQATLTPTPLPPTTTFTPVPPTATPTRVLVEAGTRTLEKEICLDVLDIELKGASPKTLTVRLTDASNTSCMLHCAEDDKRRLSPYTFGEYSIVSSEFKEFTENLPTDSLCDAGRRYWTAKAYTRRDGSLHSLLVCCSDTSGWSQAEKILVYSICQYDAQGAIRLIQFRDYTPARLELVFYLGERTMTTTVTPYYQSDPRYHPRCRTGEVTVDLGR